MTPLRARTPQEPTDPQAPAPLRVVHPTAAVDLDTAENAATAFLTALGIELDAESLRDTPSRMARAYAEMFHPRPFDLTTLPNDETHDELVLVRSIPVQSVCDGPQPARQSPFHREIGSR